MDEVPVFEDKALESDIKTLATEIERNRGDNPEMVMNGEKELVKEAIRAFPSLNNKERIAAVPTPAPPAQPVVGTGAAPKTVANNMLPDYAQNAPAEVKLEIEYLLDMAFHQGITKALSESEKSPYFVQDAFHDALAGKLYPELQKRGIVK